MKKRTRNGVKERVTLLWKGGLGTKNSEQFGLYSLVQWYCHSMSKRANIVLKTTDQQLLKTETSVMLDSNSMMIQRKSDVWRIVVSGVRTDHQSGKGSIGNKLGKTGTRFLWRGHCNICHSLQNPQRWTVWREVQCSSCRITTGTQSWYFIISSSEKVTIEYIFLLFIIDNTQKMTPHCILFKKEI